MLQAVGTPYCVQKDRPGVIDLGISEASKVNLAVCPQKLSSVGDAFHCAVCLLTTLISLANERDRSQRPSPRNSQV